MADRTLYEKRVGTMVHDKWTLTKLLGVGGMACVYEATHKIGRREAIKILHPEVARNEELCRRFEREAQAVNQLKHAAVVEVRDIDKTAEGVPFMVMELLEGENLGERAQRLGGIPEDELLGYTDELLDVLKSAHVKGIIHRDIKLDNLFITTDGQLKVLDFGVARMRQSSRELLTKVGATVGTVAYMPPEQVRGEEIDARADIFAVGATLFRVLAKRRIHDARTESEMLVKMATLPAPPLCEVAPHVPASIGLVVDRALAFSKERRYPDAGAMQADVRACREGRSPSYAAARLAAGDLPTEVPKRPKAAVRAAPAGAPAVGPEADAPTRVDNVGLAGAGAGAAAVGIAALGMEPTAAPNAASAPASAAAFSAEPTAPDGASPPSGYVPHATAPMAPLSGGPSSTEPMAPLSASPGPVVSAAPLSVNIASSGPPPASAVGSTRPPPLESVRPDSSAHAAAAAASARTSNRPIKRAPAWLVYGAVGSVVIGLAGIVTVLSMASDDSASASESDDDADEDSDDDADDESKKKKKRRDRAAEDDADETTEQGGDDDGSSEAASSVVPAAPPAPTATSPLAPSDPSRNRNDPPPSLEEKQKELENNLKKQEKELKKKQKEEKKKKK